MADRTSNDARSVGVEIRARTADEADERDVDALGEVDRA